MLSALSGNTSGSILGLAIKRQSGSSVEVHFRVDPGTLLRLGALSELLGYRRCFR